MDIWLIFRFVIFFVLLFLSAVFSGSEVALFSLSPVQVEMLREKGGSSGRIVYQLHKFPRKLLVTIYIGNELINVAIAAVSTMLALHFFGSHGIAAAVGIGTFMVLVFGEITPKTFAFRHAERYSLAVARPLLWFSMVINPLQVAITWVINRLLSLMGVAQAEENGQITEEEMKTVLASGEVKGVIESDEKEMILNVFELGDTQVTEIMTPRTEIFALPVEEGFETIVRRASLSNYSRIPVYRKDPDHIIGILYNKDLLMPDKDLKNGKLEEILHDPYLIPATKKIDELLREFRRKQIHLAVVMDEYGGVEGLVTLEDILEEVLGEETDARDYPNIQELKPGRYIVGGRLPLDEFNKYFNTSFEVEDIDTVGGLVFHLFGRMPRGGESVSYEDFTFTVKKLKGAKIWQLSVKAGKRENRRGDEEEKGETR